VLALLSEHAELVGVVVAVMGGLVETVRQYRKTGRFRLVSLPLRALKRLIYEVRRVAFTVPSKRDEQVAVDVSLSELKEIVGTQSYELEWPLSFAYHGEDMNARRYYYESDYEYPHRQVHIRAFQDGEEVRINAHEAPAPIQHPVAHWKSNNVTECTEWVANNLSDLYPQNATR